MIKFRQILGDDATMLLVAWAALFIFFYSLQAGITSTNDGSHFALIKSLVENRTAALGSNDLLAGHDSATYKGRRFADRNPGLAFVAYVFVEILAPLRFYFSRISMDPYYMALGGGSDVLVAMVMLIPALCGALLFVVLTKVFRSLGLGRLRAALFSAVLLTSSLTLRYSTVLYSHLPATLLVSSAYLMLMRFYDDRRLPSLFWGNLFLAAAVVIELPTLLIYVPVILFLVLATRETALTPRGLGVFLASAAIPAIPFLVYNYVNFDNPLSIAHFHHTSFNYFQNPGDIFKLSRFPLMFKQVVLYAPGFTSLLASSPYYLLGFLAAIAFARGRPKWNAKHSLALAALAVSIIPATTFSGDSGYDYDYRQMLFGLPFAMIFVAISVNYIYAGLKSIRDPRCLAASLGLVGLAVRGWIVNFEHIRHVGQFQFPTPFVNAGPALRNTLPIIVIGALVVVLRALRRHGKPSRSISS
jgi:hypothetical protein